MWFEKKLYKYGNYWINKNLNKLGTACFTGVRVKSSKENFKGSCIESGGEPGQWFEGALQDEMELTDLLISALKVTSYRDFFTSYF